MVQGRFISLLAKPAGENLTTGWSRERLWNRSRVNALGAGSVPATPLGKYDHEQHDLLRAANFLRFQIWFACYGR
jgi:hypothetical protein